MLARIEGYVMSAFFPLFLLACAWLAPQTPIDIAPAIPTLPAVPTITGLPPGYHADTVVLFVLMTAPLQNTSALADRESLAAVAAAYPNQRVCVVGVDSESIEHDSAGGTWYGVLGLFCMPPFSAKTKS